MLCSGGSKVVVSEKVKIARQAVRQNSCHYHPHILDFGHPRRIAELTFQKFFEWLGTVRPLATEHSVFQLEVETKTLL